MLGIYEIARKPLPWDIRAMASRSGKKEIAETRALEIARRLAPIQPENLSEKRWTEAAGVSASFFSNLRGTPTKPPSEPSVGNLRDILHAADVTLAEFFLPEARGRVVLAPSRRELERAVAEALVSLPKKAAERPQYLVEAVLGVLGLPKDRPAKLRDAESSERGDHEEDALPRAATKRA